MNEWQYWLDIIEFEYLQKLKFIKFVNKIIFEKKVRESLNNIERNRKEDV